ncbi:HTH domain-containing protein [Natronospirillum operosum]|uniref:HTH-type transcriptional repressor AllR n=1 Tax=Natronospirillum operosum TaxID=2759953 RepID=A0A4Z0WEC4_9GAMM|nr:helix-turn-helix domain-containing protein [Natronospirillum operosum]TGG93602.1 HTH domain-containing protein [Natronospirillum operosum]
MTKKNLSVPENLVNHVSHAETDRKPRFETSIQKALSILKLLSPAKPRIKAEDVTESLRCSPATAYRYIEALTDIGLLSTIGGGYYGVGPRVVELDRTLQLSDPLIHVGQKVMRKKAEEVPNSVLRLCGLFEGRVICLHSEGPEYIRSGEDQISLVHGRGVTVPLFRNAASLSILAFLPLQRAQNLYLENAPAIQEAGLGSTWKEFWAYLTMLKQRGYVYTAGRNNPELAAVSVPIGPAQGGQIFGSLTRVYAHDWFRKQDLNDLVQEVKFGGEQIQSEIIQAIPSN